MSVIQYPFGSGYKFLAAQSVCVCVWVRVGDQKDKTFILLLWRERVSVWGLFADSAAKSVGHS